jgi:CotH kinase protein/Lamin Tail Domain/Chitobiase/beta-hexosaminidase C-terminal domain/Divergent InlB B-repeat domain
METKRFILLVLVFQFIFLLVASISAQTLKINEVVSANFDTALDEDGDASDWIELYNAGTSPVNLLNYGLSDNENNLSKWIFPDKNLDPDEFLLVFASGKDRILAPYWDTIIDWGDTWKYFIGLQAPPIGWQNINFDDSTWLSGASGFGDGDDDDATEIEEIGQNLASSVFIRNTFIINDVNDIAAALLHVDYDDTFVAWMNGVEIARENIGFHGNYPLFNEQTDILNHEAEMYTGGYPSFFNIEDIESILQTGVNVLSIQCNTLDTDMTLIPFLTFGYKTEPATAGYVSPYVEPNLLNLHTNFKLNSEESVYLSDAAGTEIDHIIAGGLLLDVSVGRQPDGNTNTVYFYEPTADSSNTTAASGAILEEPIINQESGFYDGSIQITISSTGSDETIYISFDGSVPSDSSSTSYEYISSFPLNATKTLRARSFRQGFVPSETVTKTYFFNTNHYMPVISLTSDPYNLNDENYGIYALGPNAGTGFPYVGANFWQDWERPIHFELFETDNSIAISTECGIKIFGFASRGHDQKSLALFARGQYGDSSFEHQIFPDKDYSSFQSIVLRNSGGDWLKANFRDGFMAANLKGTNLAYQAYRPAVVYMNGEYWGIYNIREKLNEHFYASNFGIDPNNFDYIENNRSPIIGDETKYVEMMNFIETHEMSVQEDYDHVCTLMDIENFVSYNVAQIWYGNIDWPGANNKYWRERVPDAKWRWQIYDLDLGMGLYTSQDENTLEYALSDDGPWTGKPYRNQPWATYLLRRMAENEEFVEKFVNRFTDYMNTIFEAEALETKVENEFEFLKDEMVDHMTRWNGDYDGWIDNEQLIMKYFVNGAPNRNEYMLGFLKSQFDLGETIEITGEIYPNHGGHIKFNDTVIDSLPWTGIYFSDYQVSITAIPAEGYEFNGWTGYLESDEISLSIQDSFDVYLVANFKEIGGDIPLSPVINEINYNSSVDLTAGDWVEIYNPSEDEMDLSGWHFKDSDDAHDFEFPQNYILGAKQYVVLCQDLGTFTNSFPNVANFLGQFDFGLSGSGEKIRLMDNTLALIDSLEYGVEDPWPVEPNGTGPTLSLKNPGMDNTLAENWAASSGNGTPGIVNDVWEPFPPPFSDKLEILTNFPNPFNASTTITYSIPEKGKVVLSVYNLKGQLVKKLVNEVKEVGAYTKKWYGRNAQNKLARSGVYIYQIRYNEKSKTKKMMLVR